MEDFDDLDPDETYSINVEQVIDNRSLMSMTRDLARKLQKESYVTVGEFITMLDDKDLTCLINLIPNDDNVATLGEKSGELMLMSELLALGEGLPSANVEDIMARTSFFTKLLIFESLYRKGLINAYHENWTLDLDINNETILVETIPGVTPSLDDLKRLTGPDKNDQ